MTSVPALIVAAVRADLRFLHESWMAFFFPHQRDGGHPVLGRYRPQSTPGLVGYWLLFAIGLPLVVLLYPFVVLGFVLRLATMTLSHIAIRLGLSGVILVVGVVWGILSIVALIQLERSEFFAVGAAAVVATISAGIAVLAQKYGHRGTTVVVAYPAGVTAIFLPPVVAALLWDPLGELLLPASDQLAAFILDEFLFVFGLNELIRETFDLEGPWFLAMWFSLSLVVGWTLGTIVTLADKVRPREDEETDAAAERFT